MSASIHRHRIGETVKVTVDRGNKIQEVTVRLDQGQLGTCRPERRNPEPHGRGAHRRANDFANVWQHNTVLKPSQCGGPLVDSNGKVLGINIAHAGASESYCIPAAALLPLMYDLMSGRLAPPPNKPAPRNRPPKSGRPNKMRPARTRTWKRTRNSSPAAKTPEKLPAGPKKP